MGSNLPPGVNVSDIPGNRPEDDENETFWNELETTFASDKPEMMKRINQLIEGYNDFEDILYEYVMVAKDLAYAYGYGQGKADEAEAQYYAREEEEYLRNQEEKEAY